jgi:hypothetical protein
MLSSAIVNLLEDLLLSHADSEMSLAAVTRLQAFAFTLRKSPHRITELHSFMYRINPDRLLSNL